MLNTNYLLINLVYIGTSITNYSIQCRLDIGFLILIQNLLLAMSTIMALIENCNLPCTLNNVYIECQTPVYQLQVRLANDKAKDGAEKKYEDKVVLFCLPPTLSYISY